MFAFHVLAGRMRRVCCWAVCYATADMHACDDDDFQAAYAPLTVMLCMLPLYAMCWALWLVSSV
jgi:hypothetical protein